MLTIMGKKIFTILRSKKSVGLNLYEHVNSWDLDTMRALKAQDWPAHLCNLVI